MPPFPENFDPAHVRAKVRTAMVRILDERGPKKTACPSTIAKEVSETGWDQLMPVVCEVAKKLADEDQIQVTQQGEPVDPVDATGPIRLGIMRSSETRSR